MANIFESLKLYEKEKLQKEERDRKHYLESFKKPSKKKLSHLYDDNNYHVDSTTGIHPYKMTILDDQKSNFIDCSSDNQKKNISWRSPLIFSPGVKFSPVYSEKLDNEYKVNDHNLSSDSSFGSSKYSKHSFNLQKTPKRPKDQNVIKKTPIKSSQFPLSDKDYNYSQGINKTKEMKMDKYSDIFSPKLRLNGFKKKEKTSTPRLLTKHSPVTACEFYISETNKLRRKENVDPNSPKNVEPNSPKNVQIRNDIEEMEENDSNTSINFCEKESFLNYSDDEIISQNRPIPEEYIEPKIRNKYPVYPEIESPTIDRSVNRPMQRSIHYSNYVNPMQSDYHPNNYGQQYHESPIDTMHNYGYAAPPCEMRYVPPYGPVERPYQYAFDQKMTPRRSFSPEERYETLLIPKPVPLNPQSRCFYRPPAMMQEDSFLMPSSSVNYNQNVSKQGYFPRNEYPVPYGYIPEYQHNQVVGDKDYVMSNYWRSLNSEQQ